MTIEEIEKQMALTDRMLAKMNETQELRILNNKSLRAHLRRRDVDNTRAIYKVFNSRIFGGVLSIFIGSATTVLSHDITLGSYVTLGSFYLERLVPKMMYATSICDSLTVKEINEEVKVANNLNYRYNLRLAAYNLVFEYTIQGKEAIVDYLVHSQDEYPIALMLEDEKIAADKKVAAILRHINLIIMSMPKDIASKQKTKVVKRGKQNGKTK